MFKKILVVVNETAASQAAILVAIGLAKTNRANLMLFHVLPRFEVMGLDVPDASAHSSKDFERDTRERGSQLLARASALAEFDGVQSFRAMGFAENDAKCVADAAVLHHCDLIVVGTEGRNALVRLLTGSIVPGLITVASVPVMVCKDSVPLVKRRHSSKVRFRSQKKSALVKPKVPELTQHGAVYNPTQPCPSNLPRFSLVSQRESITRKGRFWIWAVSGPRPCTI